jgi:hypothetical protein
MSSIREVFAKVKKSSGGWPLYLRICQDIEMNEIRIFVGNISFTIEEDSKDVPTIIQLLVLFFIILNSNLVHLVKISNEILIFSDFENS